MGAVVLNRCPTPVNPCCALLRSMSGSLAAMGKRQSGNGFFGHGCPQNDRGEGWAVGSFIRIRRRPPPCHPEKRSDEGSQERTLFGPNRFRRSLQQCEARILSAAAVCRAYRPNIKTSPGVPTEPRAKFYSIFSQGGAAVVGKSGRREILRWGKVWLRRHTGCMARSRSAAPAQKIQRAPQTHGRRDAPQKKIE